MSVLCCFSVYVWTERVAALVDESLWVDALAVSLQHYENTVVAFKEAVDAAEKKAKSLSIRERTSLRAACFVTTLVLDPWLSVLCMRSKAWLAAPVLLAHAEVTITLYVFNGSKPSAPGDINQAACL
jgi:hypothetical protein